MYRYLNRLSGLRLESFIVRKSVLAVFLVLVALVRSVYWYYPADDALMCQTTDHDVATASIYPWKDVLVPSVRAVKEASATVFGVNSDAIGQSGANLYCLGMCADASYCGGSSDIEALRRSFKARSLDRILEQASLSGEFIGLVVGVVEKGEVVLEHAFGKTDTSTMAQPVTPRTVFSIASVSKSFAGAAVSLLVQDEIMNYDEPISKYVPGFALSGERRRNKATLEFALSHQLGLPFHAGDLMFERGVEFEDLIKKLRYMKARCAVGTCYAYQNIGFNLVQSSVESASQLSYAEFLTRRVFEPLGMKDASVGLQGLISSKSWAKPHTRTYDRRSWRQIEPGKRFYQLGAASGVNASLNDMTQWLRAMTGYAPHVFDAKTLENMFEARVETRYETWRSRLDWKNRLKSSEYALGWRKYNYAGHTVYGHSGAVRGYRSQVVFSPELDVGVVGLWNTSTPMGRAIGPSVLDSYLDVAFEDWFDLGIATPDDLKTSHRTHPQLACES